MNMLKNAVYMIYTKDKYELPLAVSTNMDDLARYTGLKRETLYEYISRQRSGVCKVYLEEAGMIINQSIVDRSIKHYGEEKQLVVTMEECCEMAQAVSKYIRLDKDAKEHKKTFVKESIEEEIADVLISIEIIKTICDIKAENIQDWVDLKQTRILERIKREREERKEK